MNETEIQGQAEYESVEFETGWFVVRERASRGENGQWLATRTPARIEQ